MTQLRTNKKRTKKRSSLKRGLKITLITLVGLFIIAGGTLAYMGLKLANITSSAQQELERGDRSELRNEAVSPINDPISILFLGIDSREEDLTGRTDAMLLATFNPKEGSIKMLNIPRDSYVEIVGRGTYDKINHAHAFGGVDMTIDTVENLLNIPVDYFVTLNFTAFMEIIDELGGVEVDVTQGFTEKDNATYGTIILEEGRQTVNGAEALAYVRMRKQDPLGDLGRGERQKEVIEAVINKAASLSSITKFGSLMDALGNNLNTNITFNNILGMYTYIDDLNNVESLSFENGDNFIENSISYHQLNEESVREISEILQVHLGMKDAMEVAPQIGTENIEEAASYNN
ncbi:cell envelope-related function transcriptional attenuator common domain-containing protein [Evansella caseinilytica]|uniref:Cell envelope-related function transcriptional attenuator common domain-containing protein n=1 Tax=Evansella caseinilytica TaxID=1503961 RepID=A0A1H3S4K1_9BACI|nr:LCP family protein [Evansella caseinilytica]SDZ33013.1 cell envelope-related function transcriptional attenuator common domain-containing protein [Evansella caseinilytica]